jgi:uncharacterized protein YcfJ
VARYGAKTPLIVGSLVVTVKGGVKGNHWGGGKGNQ